MRTNHPDLDPRYIQWIISIPSRERINAAGGFFADYRYFKHFLEWSLERVDLTMASNYSKIEFVNLTLTAAQKKQFAKWFEETRADLFAHMLVIAQEGYRLSVSFADKNDMIVASYTCKSESSPNVNKCVSSRHDDPEVAVGIAVYKLIEMLGFTEWSADQLDDDWG